MHIRVVPYNAAWPALFQEEADRLRAVLGENLAALHHIGSTAVPGLAAKPILDLMPVVYDLEEVDRRNPAFEALGYECMGEFGIPGRRYFRKGGDDRTHQVHIFAAEDEGNIRRHLAVRDYLRVHPEEAAAYSRLKMKLARRYPEDLESYCLGKEDFVQKLESRALLWYGSRKERN